MILNCRYLILELLLVLAKTILSNGQNRESGSDTTPHIHTSTTDTDGWDPPDPTSWSPTFSIVPGISIHQTQDSTWEQTDTTTSPLVLGGRAREGYFQALAIVDLPQILPILGYTSISLRTCSHGTIFRQNGEDSIQLDLNEEGNLNLTLNRRGRSHSTVLDNVTLDDNKWHRVYLKYELGSLKLGADEATAAVVVANVTGEFSDFLQLNLWSTNPHFIIGDSFVGCILEGSNTQISSTEALHRGVDWSSCPLPVGANCSGYGTDPCFPRPCRGRGNCEADGDNFTCDCYSRYSGRTCEQDEGPLCDRLLNRCDHGGVCQEDPLGNGTFCMCPTGYTGDRCQDLVESICNHNPCQNNGTCSVSLFGDHSTCSCPFGFTGDRCENDENLCHSEPCLHGGICTDLSQGFQCDCANTGYQGDICEVNINECLAIAQCAQGATCFDLYGSYECVCAPGFGGNLCETHLDECSSNPCQNEGICTDALNAFVCLCPSGFEGDLCETNIDDCFDVFCPNDSVCVDATNDYSCICEPGHTGSPPNCVKVNGCDSSPCENEATCFDEGGDYTCICPPGITGINCESNIDDCRDIYCENGGRCADGLNNYTCLCTEGFAGLNCQINIDECQQNVCLHASNCTDTIGNYSCDCLPGWSGRNCDTEIDECSPSPCVNNATCVNTISGFKCLCTVGYEGLTCDEDINYCINGTCMNGGTCVDGIRNYTCACDDSFMGPRCEELYDACASHPCSEGSTCETNLGQRSFYCRCRGGFNGDDCSHNIDDCVGISCEGGTVCHDLINDYECRCPNGFEGANCLTEINECLLNECQNGGTCQDAIANYTCVCPTGYTGHSCEFDIDECEVLEPCINGICVNQEGSYLCYCQPGFSGSNCSLEFDECLYRPCQNNATCLNQINKYECVCAAGFEGKECQVNIDECEIEPCRNNGTCNDGINAFTCECHPGFTDNVCATNIDECESNPCQHEGSCMDGINMYECDCDDTGFKGDHCEINIDDCESSPCQHGSNCTDLIKDYSCSCYDGYAGKNCEEDIQECESSPCQHDGRCYEFSNITYYELGIFDQFSYATAGGFLCECQPGFTGDLCEINIDECASNPCQYGDCRDGINEYECLCLPGYEGVHCQIEIDECSRYEPCDRGTCNDKISDYECVCEELYGGKNCSVALLGCLDVDCQSGGVCEPLLINEFVHEFRCDCARGHTGRFCEHATTMSMEGSSLLNLSSETSGGYKLDFEFRTTLPNVILALGQGDDHFITLVLNQGRVKLQASILNRYNGIYSGSDLNDGEWHKIRLLVNGSHALLSSDARDLQEPLLTPSSSGVSFPTTFLGGITSNLQVLVNEPFYTGCLRDIILNDVDIVLTLLQPYEKQNVIDGCPREEQCSPNPCNNHGSCGDLWTSYECHCPRPYLGDTCSMSFTPATFGNEDIEDSVATIDIPQDDQPKYRQNVDISMLIRSRQSTGIIFYLGSPLLSNTELGLTYILAELDNGQVTLRLRLEGSEEMFTVPQLGLDDGNPHLLHIDRSGAELSVSIDDQLKLNETLALSGDLAAEILYLGGIPRRIGGGGQQRRLRRQLGVAHPSLAGRNFKGVIQDVRLSSGNDTKYVQLFPLEIDPNENFDVSILTSLVNATELNNILNGTVSDDTCSITPCLEGGICSITFNDFDCDCPTGFKGKICDELEYCAMHRCPYDSLCQNLIDGYECLTNATFNGKNSSLIYEPHFGGRQPRLTNFSLTYRSQVGGIIMSAGTQDGSLWVGIGDGAVVLQQTNQTTVRTHFRGENLLDGDWHSLWISFDPTGLRVYFDNLTLLNSDLDDSIVVDFDLIVKTGGIQVGSLPEGINLRSGVRLEDNNSVTNESGGSSPPLEQFFRGCLGDVRVQNILLPFYPERELLNNTALNTFVRRDELGTSLGCQVCFDYECRNGGSCSSPNTTYSCSCPPGFEGELCQINIDECHNNSCVNGAMCIDGINQYSCACMPGYEGHFCETDIDECKSYPCLNGGTCHNQLATFECDCLEDYIGVTCRDLKIKNCSNNQCVNGATCTDIYNPQLGLADDYLCNCLLFYEGRNCENEVDFCFRNDILCDKGTCVLTHEEEGWMCNCQDGFEGTLCRLQTNECATEPCFNGAQCVDLHLDFECRCTPGWTGRTCEEDKNECEDISNLCNNGVCFNKNGSYVCDCYSGYCGSHCYLTNPCYETDLNCTNNGVCVGDCDESTNMTVPSCDCFDGWKGEFCADAVEKLSAEALSIIIGVVVGLMMIVAIVGLVVFLMMAKKKRETSGTYSPSKQEYINPRVEMGNMMKPPPEERLI